MDNIMIFDNMFFDLYNNYLFIPIYFFIGLIFQIDKMFKKEMDIIFCENENNFANENNDEKKK